METKIKICGLSRPEDIAAANELRPEYIGFVFAKSKRQVSAEAAAALRWLLHPVIQAVGVFVNNPPDEIAALCKSGVIDIIQLHGEENDAYIATLRGLVANPIIRALGVGESVPALPEGIDHPLFDTLSPERGGTGEAFDWALLEGYDGPPYFLAGGLSPENVGEAVRRLRPYCVDVSSGVETDGRKDPAKMRAFVRQVRACSGAVNHAKGDEPVCSSQ